MLRTKPSSSSKSNKDAGVFRRQTLVAILRRLDELDGEDRRLVMRMLMPYVGINISHNTNCVIVNGDNSGSIDNVVGEGD